MKKKKVRRTSRAFYAALSYISPRWNTELLYLRKFGRLPDLKHPQTLNEKLLRQKLERFGTAPVVRRCADKYRVRDYVAGCGCGGTLNRLLAVYDRPEDIDWDALPEQFAVKWNFGCGYNLICADKRALDTAGIEGLDAVLEGPTAVAFGFEDAVAAAKITNDFIKAVNKMEIKAGYLEGKAVDVETVKALANLPSREVLLAKVMGSINSTVASFVRTLAAIRDQKSA